MMRFTVFNEQTAGAGQRAARVVSVIQQQPSWITRAALSVAFLVVTAILLVIVVPAMLLAAVLFIVLMTARRLWLGIRQSLGFDRSGRRNVRVITRE